MRSVANWPWGKVSSFSFNQLPGPCDCDAYGNTIVYEAAGAGGDWFADDARSIYSEDPAGSCCPTCEFIFTGRRFDPETSDAATQMYYYRARYYSPVLGRFISRDPIDYAGGMNLYEYVGGMATGAVDPNGWELITPGGGTATYSRGSSRSIPISKPRDVSVALYDRLDPGILGDTAGRFAKGEDHEATAKNFFTIPIDISNDYHEAAQKLMQLCQNKNIRIVQLAIIDHGTQGKQQLGKKYNFDNPCWVRAVKECLASDGELLYLGCNVGNVPAHTRGRREMLKGLRDQAKLFQRQITAYSGNVKHPRGIWAYIFRYSTTGKEVKVYPDGTMTFGPQGSPHQPLKIWVSPPDPDPRFDFNRTYDEIDINRAYHRFDFNQPGLSTYLEE